MYIRIYRAKNKDNTVREYLQIVETKRVWKHLDVILFIDKM